MPDKGPFQKTQRKPFEKPFPAKDNWPAGRNNKSYRYDTEMVHVFNNNSADKSPTTSSDTYKPKDRSTFLPRPPKYK